MTRTRAWVSFVFSVGCASDLPDVVTDGSSTTSSAGVSSSEVGTTVDPDATTTQDESSSSTTGLLPVCTGPDGTYGQECPEDAPFCVGGMCVGCNADDDLTDCANAPEAPGSVCDEDGRCVVCTPDDPTTCSGNTPVCEPETNTCVPCTEHDQCGVAACNLFTGRCVEGMVINVVQGPGVLQAAVNTLSATGGGTIIVHDGTYDEAIIVRGGIVAFLAAPGASPDWRRTQGVGAPQLRITGGVRVLVDGIDFRLNGSGSDPAVRVDNSTSQVWLDRSTIAQNSGVGVRVETGAELMMRNCFVGGDANVDALEVITNATATVLYSTLAAEFGSSSALSCDGTATVTVSDSILLARDSDVEVECASLNADHTATNMMELMGDGNVPVGATDETWFANYNTGDFHLINAGPATFMDIAQWDPGDPTVDIDGNPRPDQGPSLDFAGADVP